MPTVFLSLAVSNRKCSQNIQMNRVHSAKNSIRQRFTVF